MNPSMNQQYGTSQNLSTRIDLHAKYTVNPAAYHAIVHGQYAFHDGCRILEIGCGTGWLWVDRIDHIGAGSALTLTDLSQGMLDKARDTLGERDNVTYAVVDVMSLPYADASYDVVIANMMLYHAPSLDGALREIRRVLKPGGTLYSSTYGENGIGRFISEALSPLGICMNNPDVFTLENGHVALERHFATVERYDYVDALHVTDVDDLVAYAYSAADFMNSPLPDDDTVRPLFDARRNADGVIAIPKAYCMFVSRGCTTAS